MCADSTRRTSRGKAARKKPRKDFPLYQHAAGYWAKKIRGSTRYFGKIADDPKGKAALQKWLDEKDDLLAGREPRAKSSDGATVADVLNAFRLAKQEQREAGDISERMYQDYVNTCDLLASELRRNRLVDDLRPEDFQQLRSKLAKRYGVHRLGNTVQHVRTIFKFAYDNGTIDRPVRFGPTFKKPSTRIMRAHRQKAGEKMFEAATIRAMLDATDQPLRAMILLGVNCGFGNHDCASLPLGALDLDAGFIDFPRPKTAIERRVPLWPETVDALRQWLSQRPQAKRAEHKDRVFVTKFGGPWGKDRGDSPISSEFHKLLLRLEKAVAGLAAFSTKRWKPAELKLHRQGLGFYALRHTFETIGGESKDQVAVSHIMGHADATMAGIYRERISDQRLRDVVEHVRAWLWPELAEPPADERPAERKARRKVKPRRKVKRAERRDDRPRLRIVG